MTREAGDGRLELTPVARIRSDFPEKFGIPRQSGLVRTLTAQVVFEPEFRDPAALRGGGFNSPGHGEILGLPLYRPR